MPSVPYRARKLHSITQGFRLSIYTTAVLSRFILAYCNILRIAGEAASLLSCSNAKEMTNVHVETNLLGFSARAVLELVGPIKLRHSLMAFCLAKTRAYTGPLVMKLTSVSKKDFPLCSP